jgi:tRNA(Ile)-lysidine synthase
MVPGTTVLPANQGVVETKWLGRGDLPPTWEQVSPFEFYLDADRFTFPLYLRPRRPGDRFTPLGLGGSKKVKELFIAAKIPRLQRAAYPLLVDGEGRVLGVLGLRPAAQSKITVESRRVLYLNYRRLS